ncbi:hypothetical protein BC826DRAFT_969380 [Russula brevipes]|nr:hypothetical protein BC826DRAFT_969380 [Russula brevipes]
MDYESKSWKGPLRGGKRKSLRVLSRFGMGASDKGLGGTAGRPGTEEEVRDEANGTGEDGEIWFVVPVRDFDVQSEGLILMRGGDTQSNPISTAGLWSTGPRSPTQGWVTRSMGGRRVWGEGPLIDPILTRPLVKVCTGSGNAQSDERAGSEAGFAGMPGATRPYGDVTDRDRS